MLTSTYSMMFKEEMSCYIVSTRDIVFLTQYFPRIKFGNQMFEYYFIKIYLLLCMRISFKSYILIINIYRFKCIL